MALAPGHSVRVAQVGVLSQPTEALVDAMKAVGGKAILSPPLAHGNCSVDAIFALLSINLDREGSALQ